MEGLVYMNHKGTIKLETERLILRRFVLTDAEDMFTNWASSEKVTKYMSWQPYKYVSDVCDYIEYIIS